MAIEGEKEKPSKRTTNPGVRVVGGRIYDSSNGKTCHQVISKFPPQIHHLCVCVFYAKDLISLLAKDLILFVALDLSLFVALDLRLFVDLDLIFVCGLKT
jgi:hypothetical protein